jgi:branched-chain amino acid aminotransferase
VSEGSGQNLFLVRDETIYTPPVSASVLPGITRDSVITLAQDLGYTVKEQDLPREMLYIADELFFTGTAAEITPIRAVDRIQIGPGRRGPVTTRLQNAFFDYVNGAVPDRHSWLMPVSIPSRQRETTGASRQ